MIAYAGIGSRSIEEHERQDITLVAKEFAHLGLFLYSGHADGADMTFELATPSLQTVLFLPWKNFNGPTAAKTVMDMGRSSEGVAAITQFHPAPDALSFGGKCCMARNYHQIMGVPPHLPRVSFVVCCANRDENGSVWGGTGHAVRIAKSQGIPIFNLRYESVDDVIFAVKNIVMMNGL